MNQNETAALRCTGDAAHETPDPTTNLDQDTPPRKCKADVLRDRIRGVKRARRLISEAKQIARWRCDTETLFALARASEWLGRERLKLFDELEREEESW